MNISIEQAMVLQAEQVVEMAKELLCEMMEATLQSLARSLLGDGTYVVLLALNAERSPTLGFVSMFEGAVLYTEGVFWCDS